MKKIADHIVMVPQDESSRSVTIRCDHCNQQYTYSLPIAVDEMVHLYSHIAKFHNKCEKR